MMLAQFIFILGLGRHGHYSKKYMLAMLMQVIVLVLELDYLLMEHIY